MNTDHVTLEEVLDWHFGIRNTVKSKLIEEQLLDETSSCSLLLKLVRGDVADPLVLDSDPSPGMASSDMLLPQDLIDACEFLNSNGIIVNVSDAQAIEESTTPANCILKSPWDLTGPPIVRKKAKPSARTSKPAITPSDVEAEDLSQEEPINPSQSRSIHILPPSQVSPATNERSRPAQKPAQKPKSRSLRIIPKKEQRSETLKGSPRRPSKGSTRRPSSSLFSTKRMKWCVDIAMVVSMVVVIFVMRPWKWVSWPIAPPNTNPPVIVKTTPVTPIEQPRNAQFLTPGPFTENLYAYYKLQDSQKNPEDRQAKSNQLAKQLSTILTFAETRASQFNDRPANSPEVRELRGYLLGLQATAPDQFARMNSLVEFLKRTKPQTAEAQSIDQLQVGIVNLVRKLPASNEKIRGRMLLCVLPPALRDQAVTLYDSVQTFAKEHGDDSNPIFDDFLMRTRRPTDTVGIIVPAYFSDSAWDQGWNSLFLAARKGIAVKAIMLIDMNPTWETRAKRTKAIKDAISNKVDVIAYIDCGRGKRKLDVVSSEVKRALELYPKLNGFFFDNQPDGQNEVGYMASLVSRVRALYPESRIVSCPGSPCVEGYVKNTGIDIVCMLNTDDATQMVPGRWVANYDPGRFSALLWGLGKAGNQGGTVEDYVRQASNSHIGWIFVSNYSDYKNLYWSKLTELWDREVDVIQDINRQIRGDAPAFQ